MNTYIYCQGEGQNAIGMGRQASEQNVGWMDGYPLDCYDYQSTCGANKREMNQIFKRERGEKVTKSQAPFKKNSML